MVSLTWKFDGPIRKCSNNTCNLVILYNENWGYSACCGTVCFQAETEVSSLTKELQQIEDELDAAESRLGSITEQLKQAEAQADESERSESYFCSY